MTTTAAKNSKIEKGLPPHCPHCYAPLKRELVADDRPLLKRCTSCDFSYLAPEAAYVPEQPDLDVPECPRGHSNHWCLIRKVGRRLDLICRYYNAETQKLCAVTEKVWQGGIPAGWLDHTAPRNSTKLALLYGLYCHKDDGLTLAGLRRACPQLTLGQILGGIKRSLSAKVKLIDLADDVVYEPPSHKLVKLYRINAYGQVFLTYALRAGLIDKQGHWRGNDG